MQASLGNGIIMVVGKATRDVDYRLVGSKNAPLCKVGLVIGRNPDDSPKYANIDAWWDIADYCKPIRKGDVVLAIGTIEESEYKGKMYKNLRADFVNVMWRQHESSAASDSFEEVAASELPFD